MNFRPLVDGASANWARVSELGFGCSAIAGRVSKSDSLRALALACDSGITLYDTARSYGYGESEAVLGEFLRGRRESVVVCTKFGILPAKQRGWKLKLKPAARTALRLFPGLRNTVRRGAADQFVGGQFTVETLRSSFETSLRELKTDYVDMLLMHAAPSSVLAQDDLMEALERLVESGKVRVAGISGELAVISQFFAERPPVLRTAQFSMPLAQIAFATETAKHGDLLLVGNHPFGGPAGSAAGPAAIAELRASASISAELKEKLDPLDPQALPELALNCVLRGTGVSAVVAAMMQERHIRSNVRAVTGCRFSLEELNALRTILSSRVRVAPVPV